MTDLFSGYIGVAAATPRIKTADCAYNAEMILALMKKAKSDNVHLLCLPELCITGYTCGDLFLQDTLLDAAQEALVFLAKNSGDSSSDLLVAVGYPLVHNGKLYNTAAILFNGKILGFVPKTHIPNYREFYELRHFTPAPDFHEVVNFNNETTIFGKNLLFCCENKFKLAVEICEDLWAPFSPSISHAAAGATIIMNLSASDETAGKSTYRRSLISGQSAKLLCAYIYAGAGFGESTTDMVFSGHNLIAENGTILNESPPFGEGWAVSEIDLSALNHNRRQMNTFTAAASTAAFTATPTTSSTTTPYTTIPFSLTCTTKNLTRFIDPHPFVPKDNKERDSRCEEILAIQGAGLAKRLHHMGNPLMVIGVSGGLDSSLALLVAVRACQMIEKLENSLENLPENLSENLLENSLENAYTNSLENVYKNILAVTMPCFGTSNRTKNNAHNLCRALGIPCREIDITKTVTQHLEDIAHKSNNDVTFENAQARIRTLVLMDLANQKGGIVVGTGNLSELALGWATYNGDHMSMYGVNSGVPKTLVRHIVRYAAENWDNPSLSGVLTDILDTPVSPELLPHKEGAITQFTEDIIGPYELHDFFLYHLIRKGRRPGDIYNLALLAFESRYASDEILKYLKIFYSRFFSQQFKRSCLPDGPKIGSVSLSPRGDFRMPSDAVYSAWLSELEIPTGDLHPATVNES